MALQKTVTTPHGFTAENAYHRVESVMLQGKSKISFRAVAYKNQGVDAIPFQETAHECLYNLNGDNPIKQAYTYLKTLPEFASAVDC